MMTFQDLTAKLHEAGKAFSRAAKYGIAYGKLLPEQGGNPYERERRLAVLEKAACELPDCVLRNELNAFTHAQRAELPALKDDYRFRFGQLLADALTREKQSLKGQYPSLRIGVFRLHLDFDAGTAALFFGPGAERMAARLQLQPEVLARIIKEAAAELAHGYETTAFGRDLRAAYERALAVKGADRGGKVLLTETLAEYAFLIQGREFLLDPTTRSYRGISRAQFAWRLARYRDTEGGTGDLRLHVATFDATTDRRRSLWLPEGDEGEGTYYAYISFGAAAAE